jgi:hypothetical protein
VLGGGGFESGREKIRVGRRELYICELHKRLLHLPILSTMRHLDVTMWDRLKDVW